MQASDTKTFAALSRRRGGVYPKLLKKSGNSPNLCALCYIYAIMASK